MGWRSLTVLTIALLGCESESHPWAPGAAPSAANAPASSGWESLTSPAASASADEVSLLAEAPSLNRSPAGDGGAATDDAPELPVPIGGPWVSCYGQFQPTDQPQKDVARLAMLCGPANGMRRIGGDPLYGTVAEGQPPLSHPFKVRRGACYRVFAVGAPTIKDLNVEVTSSRGKRVAAEQGQDRWPIVHPDRPFCAFESEELTLTVAAARGKGTFAAEVWELFEPR